MTRLQSTILSIALAALAVACKTSDDGRGEWDPPDTSGAPAAGRDDGDAQARAVERGRYIVSAGMCHDCHTPLMMGPKGPERDTSRALSGHPEQLVMPPAPELPPGPWLANMAATMTAFSGPWGVSFAANLTPDRDTGIGTWTAADFIATIRSGRHLGKGRPILPPMPYDVIANYTDEDLNAIFAYLHSLKPIKNKVPSPIGPKIAAAGR